jgi:hypothetical protein
MSYTEAELRRTSTENIEEADDEGAGSDEGEEEEEDYDDEDEDGSYASEDDSQGYEGTPTKNHVSEDVSAEVITGVGHLSLGKDEKEAS